MGVVRKRQPLQPPTLFVTPFVGRTAQRQHSNSNCRAPQRASPPRRQEVVETMLAVYTLTFTTIQRQQSASRHHLLISPVVGLPRPVQPLRLRRGQVNRTPPLMTLSRCKCYSPTRTITHEKLIFSVPTVFSSITFTHHPKCLPPSFTMLAYFFSFPFFPFIINYCEFLYLCNAVDSDFSSHFLFSQNIDFYVFPIYFFDIFHF